MKKTISALLVAVLGVTLLVGCGNTTTVTKAPDKADTGKKTEVVATGEIKTGLGVAFTNKKSTDPKDGKNGKVDAQAYVAAVLVDGSGKVLSCAIDAIQSTFEFTPESEILTAPTTTFKSKGVHGDAYGMKKVSKIQKEWYEQANAFAKFAVGKTTEQIKGVAGQDGKIADADLASSVSVYPGTFQEAVLTAIKNATVMGAKDGDKVGVGVLGAATKTSQKATDKGPATAVAYNYYTATSFGADGKITSCVLDASQAKFEIKEGKIATSLTEAIKTKNELKDAYGMKKASKIQKEWYEQAAAFAKAMIGKSVGEVKAVAVNEKNKPTDADLASSVSIHVNELQEAIELASRFAK